MTEPDANFEKLEKFEKAVDQRITDAMKRAGEIFVKECREQPQGHESGFYNDKTGNLRNSIGYYLYRDGELIAKMDFLSPANNESLIAPLVEKKGYCLIGIAGMNYATHVESRGYNVITQQRDRVFILLETYQEKISKFVENYDI